MRHVISALVQNVPGVLSHISGMLASRGYNIDSLVVGETEQPEFSRMTFVVRGDNAVLVQVRAQLEKIVTVVQVEDLSAKELVERDLMLIRVAAERQTRGSILELVQIFRANVVDVSETELMIEVSGKESKVEAFIDAVRPYGIVQLVRTGLLALSRSEK
ncbi:MAG: acetolactate synthase small subunit [Planctomycetia bacterium]|nr:acetolactate synthase small subunit [Planctomycetia bacterium]